MMQPQILSAIPKETYIEQLTKLNHFPSLQIRYSRTWQGLQNLKLKSKFASCYSLIIPTPVTNKINMPTLNNLLMNPISSFLCGMCQDLLYYLHDIKSSMTYSDTQSNFKNE